MFKTTDNQIKLLIILAILFVVLVVVVSVMAFMLGQRGVSVASETPMTAMPQTSRETAAPPRIVTNTPTATSTPLPTSTATTTPSPTPSPTPIVVINHIRDLGRLETTEYAMQTVIDLKNEPNNLWEQVFGSDKLALIAEGEVVAGFDLTKVEEGDIRVDGQSVEITLPAPEILYSRIDNEKTHVYERETGLFVTPDKTLEGRARELAEKSLVDWALRRNIYDDAEKSGRLRIENLLRSLGFTDIVIKVKEKEL